MEMITTTLLIFTCEHREHLLIKTYQSFIDHCNYKFEKIILVIDGKINPLIFDIIKPDTIIYQPVRVGYVNSISKALKLVATPYFFWLEDDWFFHKKLDIDGLLTLLKANDNWVEIIYSKYGPLQPEYKHNHLGNDLYESNFGFSANPCLCNATHLKNAFKILERSEKGNELGKDGFENFLSKTFKAEQKICSILDPKDHTPVSHEGYLESTPRNWHMTNSLENKTNVYLLTIPKPSFFRRILMSLKLGKTFFLLIIKQFYSNKVYEYCFRIIASFKSSTKI